jgi:cyclophilin family peptidyl-prolyl cis-trans isomerase
VCPLAQKRSLAIRITMRLFTLILALAIATTAFASPEKGDKDKKKKSKEKIQMVKLITPMGDMTLILYNETPEHRDNFVKLVSEGFFDGLLFHRVINDFMIQGGDPDSKNAETGTALGTGGPGYTVPAEFRTDLIHKKGALSAARMGDAQNPEKRSSGSQFYVVDGKTYDEASIKSFESQRGTEYSDSQRADYAKMGGTPHLDGGYTVFGQVIEGLDAIDKIAEVAKDPRDRPNVDITMKMELLQPVSAKKLAKMMDK